MTTQVGILDKGLLAALELAAETPWADLTLSAIAKTAGLDLPDFHGLGGKDALAVHADTYFDRAMSQVTDSPCKSSSLVPKAAISKSWPTACP